MKIIGTNGDRLLIVEMSRDEAAQICGFCNSYEREHPGASPYSTIRPHEPGQTIRVARARDALHRFRRAGTDLTGAVMTIRTVAAALTGIPEVIDELVEDPEEAPDA